MPLVFFVKFDRLPVYFTPKPGEMLNNLPDSPVIIATDKAQTVSHRQPGIHARKMESSQIFQEPSKRDTGTGLGTVEINDM